MLTLPAALPWGSAAAERDSPKLPLWLMSKLNHAGDNAKAVF